MSRDEMIALLVSDTLERVMNLRQVFWLQGVLENGIIGFAKWSDEDLRQELSERGFGLDDSPVDVEDYEASDMDDNEEFLRIAGHFCPGSNLQIPYLVDSLE